jgi:T-complex protein 1 subunit beta
MTKVAEIEEAEKQKMRNKCKKIIDHGISCFINRQLIYNFPEQVCSAFVFQSVDYLTP